MNFKILVLVILCNELRAQNLIRQTQNGLVQGISESKLNIWLGIPYAEPPINNLRFKRPIPKANWTNILKADKFQSKCSQYDYNDDKIYNEDCLYLNIFVPQNGNNSNLPVLIWIHGGGFVKGGLNDNDYAFKKFSINTNIIVVKIQYRLGVFGFLYMGTNNAPGNMGLLDQNMAIKWVYDNIKHFGGDNTRITIAGQSAGAKSTGFHLISNLTNYYRNAIMMSGSPNADTIFTKQKEAIKRNSLFLKYLKCDGSPLEQVECSLKLSTKVILDKSIDASKVNNFFNMPSPLFTAVVDNYFLVNDPKKLLKRGEFKKVSIMTGAVLDECLKAFPESFQLNYLPTYPYDIKENARKQINEMYPKKGNIAAGDFYYLCPSNQLADFYAGNNQKVYKYYYTNNCCHGDEVKIVFGNTGFLSSDGAFSKMLVTYWSNFIRNDNPNDESYLRWPIYDLLNKPYINLHKKELAINYKLKEKECSLWNKIYLDSGYEQIKEN